MIQVSIRKRLSRQFCLETEFQSADRCLGILGASGCGKSMTLKCIAGIEIPDEGYIAVNGRVLFDSARKINLKPQARRVGYLFQHYALFPRMRVLENLTAALSLPKQEALQKARPWIARFGLTDLEYRYPAQLSGGQQQRTALARMLIQEPELILLDEPFSALDTHLREQMQLQLLQLLESRDDVIMVTHSRDEAYRLCDELLVMDTGRVLTKGGTKALFQDPGSVPVARITGCKNISPIRRTGERELYALDWGLSLRVSVPIEDAITHVGIRAHDFEPVWEAADPKPGAYNQIRMAITQRSEEPFEQALLFTNAEAQSPAEQGELWWKYSKYRFTDIPPRLAIPPTALLLLRSASTSQA
ncbi:MAG: ATP-binding cassette domain-containing protein [Treponema sp.]|jgi:molybdate transport system ATP-binding protein|nr:ATP-binding cassette domain-containing protein [Treponema sp.]